MKLRRWLVGGLVALLAGGGLLSACGDVQPATAKLPPAPVLEPAAAGPATATADPATPNATATPTATASPPRTVDVTGTVEPVQGQGLSFGVSGTVAEVDVTPGQPVRAGTVLARLDTASLQSQLKQAEAQVASAEAALTANQAKVANDQLAVQQAQDSLQQKQAALATAQAAETLTASVAGVVESVPANVGESLSPGQIVLAIVPPGAGVTIQTQVAQQSSQAVQVGDTASASIPATDQTVSGTVTSVGTGTAGSGSHSGTGQSTDEGMIDVTITLGSPPADLRDGVTALVNIYTSPGAPVQATGSIQYADEWQVTAPQGGTVAGLPVQPGESVTKGQAVATLTGSGLDSAVQGAEQAVQQARVALAQAQASVQADQGGQKAADQASLESARAAEQAAQADLQAATLTAPFAGTVGQVDIAVGQAVSAGGTQSQGSLSGAITLIGHAGFEVAANVPDRDMGEVHVGEKAWVTAAGAATPAQAVVAQITPQATGGASGPVFPVTLTIIGNPAGFLTGATAEVSIQVGG